MTWIHDHQRQHLLDDLHDEVMRRVRRMLAVGDTVECRVSWDGPRVRVCLWGPPVSRWRQQALSVLVLDAVRSVGHTFGQVDVSYDSATAPHSLG